MAIAISNLLGSLKPETAADYVFAAYFLICTSSFLKIRWLVGTSMLMLPIAFLIYWNISNSQPFLPSDTLAHVTIAWAVGALMSYLADSYMR